MRQPRSVSVRPLDSHRFRLGEGGRWDGTDFWQVDLLDGGLWHSAGGTAELEQRLDLDIPLGAMAPVAGGGRIVIAGTGVALLDDDGALDWIDRPVDDQQPPRRVNDAAVSRGRMYFGTMDFPGSIGNGHLWRVDPDRTVTHLVDGLGCPNGPAVTADGGTLYLADSTAKVIFRFCVDEGGSLFDRTELARVPDGLGVPDGMTVDDDDHLWVALWGGSAVARIAPDGSWDDLIAVPARQPTSVTLAGDLLYVTSAYEGLADRGELDGATLLLDAPAGGRVTEQFGALNPDHPGAGGR